MKLTKEEKKLVKQGNIEVIWDKYRDMYPNKSFTELRDMISKSAK